jgi:hypothetical protein
MGVGQVATVDISYTGPAMSVSVIDPDRLPAGVLS